MKTVAVILAAGLGKRMKSRIPKVLHPILGDPALLWVLRALPAGLEAAIVVVHHGKDQVLAALESWRAEGLLPCPVLTVDQGQPLGTGHAVRACEAGLDRLKAGRVLILSGDVPLIRAETVESLCASEGSLLAMEIPDPTGYGRVVQNLDGSLSRLVEQRDAGPGERAITLVNGGAYALPWAPLKPALHRLKPNNAQGELYLTDAVMEVAAERPVKVELCDPEELAGMNSRDDQAALQASAQWRTTRRWMAVGVSFLDASSTFLGPRVVLGQDVLIEPSVRMEGLVKVGAGTRIGQGSIITGGDIGKDVSIRPYSIIEGARIGDHCVVGPFARLREGTELQAGAHVGNFVETKQTLIKKGAKANHLAYLGDSEVGANTNIGAGVIFCNYDGVKKHRTTIGKDAFIGSDSQLVAPVAIGDGAVVAAGSTITGDVPAGALAMTRPALVLKEEGAVRYWERLKKKT
ncbi:MAG: bifunctional UDP-N-acetylglucosamine diphosphorylase/glucosamine-1-phosphate N-acetyltransferase GlmU [Holophagaceae bacterium]|nr:bifunctional UDP-N-acetylglucosamine diphosphorylase/glucosamine-1-phosphate N-acetyltransferase GlmU [Holophagaceae bacterium]